MNTLVETIQKIGIFLIAAQAIIHFAPGSTYAKYMKLIVGIMVLLLFLSPVYKIITGEMLFWPPDMGEYGISEAKEQIPKFSMNWEEMESYIKNQNGRLENVLKQMEAEIKSRLNNEMDKINAETGKETGERNENYIITNVIIKQTEPFFLQILINRQRLTDTVDENNRPERDLISGNEAVNIDTIRIKEVAVGETKRDVQSESLDNTQYETRNDLQPEETLQQRFADILGLEPDQVEVIIYGTD